MSASTGKTFELGKLYADRGDFEQAEKHLLLASQGFFAEKDFSNYLTCQNLLMRTYSEREEVEKIHQTKERLQDLVLKEGFELSAKTYYTLALCASNKSQQDVALDYLQKSLALALANDSKEDICHAIFGMASVYMQMTPSKTEEALREIYNLQVFFQFLKLSELQVSTHILNAAILQRSKKYEEAIEICWKAYEDLKATKNMYSSHYLLYRLGSIYADMGDRDMARLYIGLAKRTVDPKNFVRLSRLINKLSEKIGGATDQPYDLVFDEESHSVTERKMGKIDFKNQFILLELLKLFVQNQGQVYSKEFLVEQVWRQEYDPAVHDNKIYVTIKRLRKLIEPDYEKPKYIFRAKNGYYMNKSARILVEEAH